MKKHELHDVKQTLAKDRKKWLWWLASKKWLLPNVLKFELFFWSTDIVPAAGKGYWVAGFPQAILNFEKLITVVQCIKDGKKQYLYQITFCLTAQGQFMNCSENSIVDNCWIYGDTFMPLPPPSLMVSADKDETSDAAQNLLKGKDREVQSKE